MSSLQSLKLIQEVLKEPEKVEEHFLEALFYYKLKLPQFKTDWESNYIANEVRLDFLKELAKEVKAHKINIVILKGFALLGEIYPDLGSRYMSDIDFLISDDDLKKLDLILSQKGFFKLDTPTWARNNFKVEYQSSESSPFKIVVETHSRLFHHRKSVYEWKLISHPILPFHQLSNEGMLAHLIGHLAFQHTFVKINWLIDIYLFMLKHQQTLNWARVQENAINLKLFSSHKIIFWLLKKYFSYDIPTQQQKFFKIQKWGLYKVLINTKFLIHTQGMRLRYYIIKHLTKDSLLDAIKYDLQWICKSKTKQPSSPKNPNI